MNTPPNIILVGPMGAGKSSVGRRLAQILGREFIDSDNEIEQRTGVDIPLIFEIEGEAGFRKREQQTIADLCKRKDIVLATGGGAILAEENRRHLGGNGIVVYLRTSVDQQLRRTGRDRNRPLLQTEDPRAKLEELLEIRDPLYRQTAGMIVDTDGRDVKSVAKEILQGIRKLGYTVPNP
jgi:shikimate kinase